ncbi:MAG: isoleucine--tRNA ligase [Anaerolineaceae bacterium]
MFKAVSPKLNINVMEEGVLRFWRTNEVFKKSSAERKDRTPYVFFEGPPTANGKPGIHHVLVRAFKDMFPRYKTMNGYYVDRRGGWDTHGLPVEIEVEKKLGFTNKGQIETYGIEKFNALCRESAFERIQDWERLTERIGYWVDLDRAYVTYKNEYIESVWWLLKSIWDKGLLYQGFKVVPYCPRCGTPLSDHEVAQGYEETDDPSVFVRFPLLDDPNTYLLVWTTTPWTLPGNVAVAAHPDVDYVLVARGDGTNDERLIMAKELVSKVFGETPVKILKTFKGKTLKGKRYAPLFTFMPSEKPAYYVVNADYVTTTDGTGLVHIAPAFGTDDMQVAKEHDLPILMTVNDEGKFKKEVKNWADVFVKDADPSIIEDLDQRGLLFASGRYTHTYPFCWRCGTPLLYYARPTWFIRTSQIKDRLVELNQEINWVPEHIKNGRFGNWLENNIDWALGRNRYWGTPLPVWECQSCHHQVCVGSVSELSQLVGQDMTGMDLHRPFIDRVQFACPECQQGTMVRVKELIDVWFDSGSMPVAQWHYPFENVEEFKTQFPADFICEGVDQTRGWFYSLLAISGLVFDSISYKNVISLGLILDGEGHKMSKSRGNVVDPWEIINEHGADAIRWYLYTSSPAGNERRFSSELVGEVVRNFTLTLWNTYAFFVTYANLDGWKPDLAVIPQFSRLDYWLLSALNALVRDVTKAYEAYDVLGATRPIEAFVDQLSNWYLRRSRRRFWKSESDGDKAAAYETLYQALTTLAKLLAPTMPFVAEELYQNLVRSVDDQSPLSVHLANWPQADTSLINEKLNEDMILIMKLASLGHAARNKSSIKVRQPLAEAAFAVGSAEEAEVVGQFKDILLDELNVKSVRILSGSGEAVNYGINPLPKQLGQKYKGLYPQIRQAILDLPVQESAVKLLEGINLVINVAGKYYEILPGEVEVHTTAREGFEVAVDGPYLAALEIDLTPELINEGLAREFVRRVQALRKDGGLDIADRICLYYTATPRLSEAVQAFSDFIKTETLAVELVNAPAPGNWVTASDSFDEEELSLHLQKTVQNSEEVL